MPVLIQELDIAAFTVRDVKVGNMLRHREREREP